MYSENKEKKSKSSRGIITLLVIIILLLLLSLSLVVLWKTGVIGDNGNSAVNSGEDITEDNGTDKKHHLDIADGDDWNGDTNTNVAEINQESIRVPGWNSIVVDSKNQEIQLYNFEENTVYFVYIVTLHDKENGDRVVYESKAIAPGKSVKWNVYETFGDGTHDVTIRVDTYDVETEEQCYGAQQRVSVVVK